MVHAPNISGFFDVARLRVMRELCPKPILFVIARRIFATFGAGFDRKRSLAEPGRRAKQWARIG